MPLSSAKPSAGRKKNTPRRRQGTAPIPKLAFRAVLERSDNRLWGAHLRVPEKVLRRFAPGNPPRVICSVNGSPPRQCAIVPFKPGVRVITVNKALRDTLKLSFGDDVDVVLEEDKSAYGLPVPEELLAVFQQDAPGKRLFHALTPGKQRTLLYIIGSAKNRDKRIGRSLIIVQHLKLNHGKINYRLLSATIRQQRI